MTPITMSPYHYSSLLPGPNSIRLLRLPPKDKTARINCQLFNYSLDEQDEAPPPYEALSYVWGDPEKTLPIFIDGYRFNVTENLYAALRRLQDCTIKWIWVDAICINQQDRREQGHQVRFMVKIYSKAHRVIVWLGEAKDKSDLVFTATRALQELPGFWDSEIIQRAVLALLQRPWFRRIWVLQEVAAARRILIMCGQAKMEGYRFCLHLEWLRISYEARPDLHNLIYSVTYLIKRRNFWSTQGISSGMSFLAIRPLGELLDMFHTHEATRRHDKMYALLGMSSDAHNAADLLPEYEVPWREVFQRLIQFLLCKQVFVETWNNRETAVIKSKGCILGQVSFVVPHSGWGGAHKVDITSKYTSKYSGYIGEWSARWTLHTSAKSIRQGDIVYHIQGAPKPTIIRRCKDYFAVIMIEATPPEKIRLASGDVMWAEFSRSVTSFPHDFLLIWDWRKSPEGAQDQEEYENLVGAGDAQEHSKTSLEDRLGRTNRLWNIALILEDLEEYEEAEKRLREAMRGCERAFGEEHPHTLTGMANLASIYWKQRRWNEAEELRMQVMEARKTVLGAEHPDTLISMADLASTYWKQGRWNEAGELEMQVMEARKTVLGVEHPDTLTSMGNLASTYSKQGRWNKAEELGMQVMETRMRVLGLKNPSTLTSMSNLAFTLKGRDYEDEAISLMEICFLLRKQVLGPQHPYTTSSLRALTKWQFEKMSKLVFDEVRRRCKEIKCIYQAA